MANSNEIVQIEQIDKGLKNLNSTIDNTSNSYLKLVKSIEDGNDRIKVSAATLNLVSKVQKETADNSKQLDALGKQLAATEEKLKQTEDSRLKTLIELKIKVQEATKATTDQVKAEQAAEGSLVRMRQKLAELTAAYDKTGARTKAGAEEIKKLSKEIETAEKATNRHQRGVGGYAEQLGKMPGPIGGAVSSLMSFGKTLWLLVANPIGAVIAGIVAGFAALGAVFTSTAGGAKLIKEIMASVSAVFDVVKQSTVLVIDAFKALFSGEFSKAADLFGDSMDNLTENTGAAAKAAWDLVDAQSALNKELTFHVSEQAQENNLFQKNLFLAKDKTKSDAERLGYLKEAMAVSEENAKKEVDYARRQFTIDTDKAALKAKVSGVTADQLRAFIALGAEEQKTTLESSASLKKMWDLIGGSDKFKPLEESYAKIIEADTEYFSKNKRTMSQVSSLQNELAQERIERDKKRTDEEQKAVDAFVKGEYEKMDAEAKFLANQDKNRAEQKKEEEELYQQLLEGSEEYLKEFNDAEDEKQKKAKETADKQKEDDEKKMERAKELRDAEIELAKQALSAVFELQNSKLEKELNDLEKKKEHELSNKNLTEAQKAKIEADFDKKAAAIKTKQAQQAKIQALFDIALGTAVSVMNAKGNVPLMIVLAAMGAVQAALVAAKPIPKYAKGTMSAADRFIAGEAGPELMFLRDKSVMLAEKPTYFEGSKFKGARIFSNPETERLIGAADRRVQGHSVTDERLLNKMDEVRKAILSKPVNIVDSENRIIGQSISNHQEIYLNRLINRN